MLSTEYMFLTCTYRSHTLHFFMNEYDPRLTEMQEDLSILPLRVELVSAEEFLVLLLSDLRHDVFSFL